MIHHIFPLEVWQVDEQIDNYKESQDRPLWQAAFLDKETLKDESNQECRKCRKVIDLSQCFVSVGRRLSKYYSWRSCSNHNFNFLSQIRSYVRMKKDGCKVNWKLRLHSNPDKAQPTEKFFESSQQGKALHQKQSLKKSQRIQTGKKFCECTECDRLIIQKNDLDVHQRIYTGEKPSECCDYAKASSQKTALIAHLRIHLGEKPYECSECGNTFFQKAPLFKQRIHIGERQYKRSDCERALSRKSALTKHQRIHTGEKNYECNKCGKLISVKSTLIVYHRTHIGKKPHKCRLGKTSVGRHLSLNIREVTQEIRPKAYK